jgi:hypothetical protein
MSVTTAALSDAPDDDPPPVAPLPPDDDACCGSGCDPCIWDWYQQERDRYLVELKAWQARHAATPSGEKGTTP